AGSYVSERVFWDHRLPSGELPGDFTTPYFHGLYSVALRPHTYTDPEHFEHAWARLVYEMHRMSRDTQRSRIATLVQYRWVPVDTAVQEYARIYWSVRRELEQFYHQTWRPWAESRGPPSTRASGCSTTPAPSTPGTRSNAEASTTCAPTTKNSCTHQASDAGERSNSKLQTSNFNVPLTPTRPLFNHRVTGSRSEK
ncbi:hypothetical protein, partial [Verrucomicrobium sp. BvORR106]|uniref:hypothetical protein n=1 Tax=Verrucomicrobium sp. BvORR106 TaxID=1403819 RepID=UPI002240FCF2